jgi:hypothetical protein
MVTKKILLLLGMGFFSLALFVYYSIDYLKIN